MNDKGIERLRELFDQAEAQAQQKAHGGMFGSRISVQRSEQALEKFRLEEGTVAEVAELERKVWPRIKDEE